MFEYKCDKCQFSGHEGGQESHGFGGGHESFGGHSFGGKNQK